MTKAQKIVMWIFGLLISAAFYFWGISLNDYNGNIFIAFVLPLVLVGGMLFISLGKKKE